MFRAVLELLIMFAVVMVARAVLTSLMRGFFNASSNGFRAQGSGPATGRSTGPQGAAMPTAGELHKDPVCGTYIAARPELRRQIGDQTFYYCSEACREKHAMAAR